MKLDIERFFSFHCLQGVKAFLTCANISTQGRDIMKRLLMGLVCCCVLFLVGCGEPEPADTSEERIEIAVIPKGTTHEFWKSVHAGAVQAQREFDVDIIWKGPLKEDDREAQIAVVENFITLGVSGILLAPLDDTALRGCVTDAVRSGIPVVIFDSALESEDYVSFVATDNYKGGQLAGEHLGKLLEGKGKVVMLRYQEGSASTMKREQGFLDAIAKYEGIEIVASNQYG